MVARPLSLAMYSPRKLDLNFRASLASLSMLADRTMSVLQGVLRGRLAGVSLPGTASL